MFDKGAKSNDPEVQAKLNDIIARAEAKNKKVTQEFQAFLRSSSERVLSPTDFADSQRS